MSPFTIVGIGAEQIMYIKAYIFRYTQIHTGIGIQNTLYKYLYGFTYFIYMYSKSLSTVLIITTNFAVALVKYFCFFIKMSARCNTNRACQTVCKFLNIIIILSTDVYSDSHQVLKLFVNRDNLYYDNMNAVNHI